MTQHQILNSTTNPNSSYIKIEIKLKGYKRYHLFAYIDTGASICVASKYILPHEYWQTSEKAFSVLVANKSTIFIDKVATNLKINLCGEEFTFPKIYQQETGMDFIIDNNFLRLNHPFIQDIAWISLRHHLTHQIIYCPLETTIIKVANPAFTAQFKKSSTQKHGEDNIPISSNLQLTIETPSDFLNLINQLDEIKRLLKDTSSENALDSKINNSKELAVIKLKDESKVIRVKPMIYTPKDREEFAIQIKELLDLKLITPSNKETFDDGYFVPNKETLLVQIRGKTHYTGLDCKSGFWQIRLSKESKLLTAFSCPQGHYEWNVVPFGLKQAPGIFQRYMDNILEKYRDFCLIYVDDILIFSNTENEHYEHVKKILSTCKQKGIVLSERKAKLCLKEISFLGLEIKYGQIKLQKHIMEHIEKFPNKMEDKKILQRFLGCLTYAEAYIYIYIGLLN